MLDLDPWADFVRIEPPPPIRVQFMNRAMAIWHFIQVNSIRLYRWLELQTKATVKIIMRR
jgi:hypothetical protein